MSEENKKLTNKISKMKSNIKEIHDKFEEEIQKKVELQEKNKHEQDIRLEILEKYIVFNQGKTKNLIPK